MRGEGGRRRIDYEARFYQALKRIVRYMSPERLRRQAEKQYGLTYEEALEMAYDNIQGEAMSALKGYRQKRKPKPAEAPRPALDEAK